jgi:glycerol transport system substrate-binding protein
MRRILLAVLVLSLLTSVSLVFAGGEGEAAEVEIDMAVIDKWVDEFQPSVLTREEQRAELIWFAEAAAPLRGTEIKSTAEGIRTHYWESEVLAEAFEEITGIKVTHDVIGEGELVDRIQRQIQTGRKLYDIYVNDTDLIGMHYRANSALNLTEYMAGEGAQYTNPGLDLDDFFGLEQGKDYEGNLLQLPDQQFAILYWFRHDWFTDPDLMARFRREYGYELGVPQNWAAYGDIAEFFTEKVRTIDGVRVYGHMDYGKKSPSLGWRISDAWLAIGGMGDTGLPNGMPVDDWGIRVEDGVPVGASVQRGGALNGPAAVYAITTYVDWMKKYADPAALSMTWSEEGPVPGQGHVAQTYYMCLTWLSDPVFSAPGSAVVGDDGVPLWRVAPQPHGRYWQEGQKVGYQDTGAWTIPQDTVTGKHRHAAWLWAQFAVSKTVDLAKFLEGRTPVRTSTVWASEVDEVMDKFGGVIEFYRSDQSKLYTGTGLNVPHYPLMAEQWWQNISQIITGEVSPQQGMDNLAFALDDIMDKLNMHNHSPELNPASNPSQWLGRTASDGTLLAPKAEIRREDTPQTVPYEEAIRSWVPLR